MKFLNGDLFLIVLLVQYVVVAVVYGVDGNYGKALYFIGAAILSIGVLMMK